MSSTRPGSQSIPGCRAFVVVGTVTAVTAPYRPGDQAIFLSDDQRGVRVRETVVLSVTPEDDGWNVRTVHGSDVVDERGEGSQLLPLDDELAKIVGERGPNFILRPTHEEPHQHRPRGYDLNHTRDRDPDRGR